MPQCFGKWSGTQLSRGAAMAEAVVPFAPKSNSKSEAELDRAGQAILGLLHQAASTAEANNQKAIEMAHKLSAQLRAAEDRIRQLEATVRHQEERADRAEKWLYQISMEIEQKFFGSDNNLPPQNQRDRTRLFRYPSCLNASKVMTRSVSPRTPRP